MSSTIITNYEANQIDIRTKGVQKVLEIKNENINNKY